MEFSLRPIFPFLYASVLVTAIGPKLGNLDLQALMMSIPVKHSVLVKYENKESTTRKHLESPFIVIHSCS